MVLDYSDGVVELTSDFVLTLEENERFNVKASRATAHYRKVLGDLADEFVGSARRPSGSQFLYILMKEKNENGALHAQALAELLPGTPDYWTGYAAVSPSRLLDVVGREVAVGLKCDIVDDEQIAGYVEAAVSVLRERIIAKNPEMARDMNLVPSRPEVPAAPSA
ncbi:MAG: hypothetical protein V1887_02640 [Candidatus Aenigmatarchaeota archaeon]